MPGCSSPPVISASSRNRCAAGRVVGVLVEDLLERHLAVQLGVERHEDGAQAAPGVRPQDAEPLAVAGGRADGVAGGAVGVAVRARSSRSRRRGRACASMSGSPSRARLSRVERPAGTAARLFSTSPPCFLRWRAASASTAARSSASRSPRPTRWSARLRALSQRPGLEGGDELALVDQAVLQGEQAEEEVAVGGDGGHGAGLREGRRWRWASGPRRRGPAARPRAGSGRLSYDRSP